MGNESFLTVWFFCISDDAGLKRVAEFDHTGVEHTKEVKEALALHCASDGPCSSLQAGVAKGHIEFAVGTR